MRGDSSSATRATIGFLGALLMLTQFAAADQAGVSTVSFNPCPLPPVATSGSVLIAGGAAVSLDDAMISIGGVDAGKCTSSVVRIKWNGAARTQEKLADLPKPLAFAGAGVLGHTLYVVGGISSPDAPAGEQNLYSLDLSNPNATWQTLAPLPGPGRVKPIVVGQYGELLVFGGRAVECWAYLPTPLPATTRTGWIPVAYTPYALTNAVAMPLGESHVLILANKSLTYDAITDTWLTLGGDAIPQHVTAIVRLNNQNILLTPGGAYEVTVHPFVRSFRKIDIAVVVVYVLLITLIGVYFSKRQKSSEQFALAGRKMPWWVAALSLYATATSSISMMAVPALAFASNLVWLLPALLTLIILIPQAYVIIPLIRRLNLTSTYEYLEKRFNPELRILGSLQCIAYYAIGKASVVILLPSMAISAVTGLPVYYCICFIGLLTTVYTSLGGLDAVMWTDVLQALVMLLAPILALIAIIHGLPGGIHELIATGTQYDKFRMGIWSWDWTEPVVWIFLFDMIMKITGFAGDQSMVQRVLATPNDHVARRATIGNQLVCVGGAILVQVMGIAMFAYFHAHPELLDPTMTKKDNIVPLFVVQVMPAGVAGLIIAGILAASMSCLSGTVNSVSTLMVEDVYMRIRPRATDHTRLQLMKFFSYIAGIGATAIAAFIATLNIYSLQLTFVSLGVLCGAGFVGVYTLGLFSRRANSTGAIVGAIASVIVAFIAKFYTPLNVMLYLPLSTLTCVGVGYFVSLLTPATTRDLSGLTVYTLPGSKRASSAPVPR